MAKQSEAATATAAAAVHRARAPSEPEGVRDSYWGGDGEWDEDGDGGWNGDWKVDGNENEYEPGNCANDPTRVCPARSHAGAAKPATEQVQVQVR
jgi:hypothetical protein